MKMADVIMTLFVWAVIMFVSWVAEGWPGVAWVGLFMLAAFALEEAIWRAFGADE